jgi:bifunctional UDP-N-acetylglucosamine pyrophosphorylase/glucosamine-1-phosphate N-acetyltransferase
MVQRIINSVEQIGADSVNLVYGHGGEQLKQVITGMHLNWCLQAEQLGTGHAVQQATNNINDEDNVLILVGDAPLIKPQTLQRLLDAKAHADLGLLTVELDDATGMGRIIRDGNNVVAIVEHKDANEEQRQINEINTGMMVIPGVDLKRWLGSLNNNNAQGEFYLTDVIAMAASEGKQIRAVHPDKQYEVEGVNNRIQLASLERAFQREQADLAMLAGATLADPARFDVRGNLTVGSDVVIDVNLVSQGQVILGDNVKIGANCILIDCVIDAGAVIEANSIIEQAHVGKACTVGPFARLRPGTTMLEGSKVGNFVEMKKTTLGKGSKANHLSYLGDTEVGEKANIGAGTITCNYDGVNKSKTQIGDGAFVGSNSSLVAPVSIGINATIGAGSVVNKSVDDQQLAIARGKQRNIDGWQRPIKK